MKKELNLVCPVCQCSFSVSHFSSFNLQEEKKRLLECADCLSKAYSELEQRIDKAIYWIDEYCIKLCDEADVISELRVVKDILRGDE